MFRNYLKTIARLLVRQKTFTFLNVFGLAMGLYGFIIIFLSVRYEYNFDKFNKKIDRLYTIVRDAHFENVTYQFMPVPYAFKDAIVSEFPEIEKAARVVPWNKFVFKYGDKIFEEPVLLADNQIFDMFTFDLIEGNRSHPMNGKFDIVISERIAKKYFPNEEALGKVMQVGGKYDLTVSAVYKDLPDHSTLQASIILPIEFLSSLGNDLTSMNDNTCLTYLLLRDGTDVKSFEAKLKPRLGKEHPQDKPDELFLHPFKDMHLHNFHYKGGVIDTVYMLSGIGFIILLLSGVNYVNLVTARSARRGKEIGIRKAIGASKAQVVFQFLGESIFLELLALAVAVLFIELTLPVINPMIGKKLFVDYGNPILLTTLISFAVTAGLVAGIYPAFYLARFSPSSVLKQNEGVRGGNFKSALVILQFTVSIALIITSISLNRQFNYLIHLPVGFDKANIFYFKLEDEVIKRFDQVKKEFGELPSVRSVSGASHLPLQISWNGGGFDWEGKDPSQDVLVSFTQTDENYLKTFSIPLIEGRYFKEGEQVEDTANHITKVIINASLKNITGFKDAVGEYLRRDNQQFEIIGVIEDFSFYSNRGKAGPLLITYVPQQVAYGFVKFEGSPIVVKQQLQKKYSAMFSNYPSNFNLVNDWYESGFSSTASTAGIYGYFTVLAIIISCLGLYGLSSFMAEQRKKEIGIRKVMGATTSGLIVILLKRFVYWLVFANTIAIPVAWYFSNGLLEKYAYRVDFSIWVFVLATMLSVFLTGITVAVQIYRVVNQNPSNVLKYE